MSASICNSDMVIMALTIIVTTYDLIYTSLFRHPRHTLNIAQVDAIDVCRLFFSIYTLEHVNPPPNTAEPSCFSQVIHIYCYILNSQSYHLQPKT